MRRSLALLAVLVAGGCAGDDEAAETVTVTVTAPAGTTTTAVPPTWTGPDEPREDGALPVDAFNAYAESVDEPWERDLALVTAEFVQQETIEASNTAYQGSANNDTATTSLVLDGLFDDSVRAWRYDLTLSRRPDGTWRVDSARWGQRCQRGRGHQAFTAEPCI